MFLLLCAVVLVLVLDWGFPIIVNDDALVFELALAAALALHETEVRAICHRQSPMNQDIHLHGMCILHA